jgi:ATP-binding cassette subfamily F protein uup
MNILSLENVEKKFGAGPLFQGVTFGLEHDEKMGLIGRNGSGKTTLLRIVAGVETPDVGRVVFANNRLIGYVPQNPIFATEQTVLDAVFDQPTEALRRLHDYTAAVTALESAATADPRLVARVADLSQKLEETGGWALEANAKAVLHRLGIAEVTQMTRTLSGGQRKRVALARGLVLKPDLLILDEPTNHLDPDTIAWLESYLATYAGALLLVTHDRYFLDRVTNRMLELENGATRRYEGNYTIYLEKKAEQLHQRESEAIKRDNLVRRELAWLRRGAKARSTKQKARVDRAETLIAEPKAGPERKLELSALSSRLGNKILELERIEKSYGSRRLFTDFTLRLKGGDRLGLIGPNGAGKTTLLEVIAGRLAPDVGLREVGATVVIGYFDQESRALEEDMRVIDYIKSAAENVRTADGSVITAGQMLERFLFSSNAQYTPVGKLSGGERRRLYLLRILMQAPNVLLLDEPTNDFDIATLVALEEYLETFAGCLIVASHDRAFLDRTVEQVFHLDGCGRVKGYPGNYSVYLDLRAREPAALDAASTARPNLSRSAVAMANQTARTSVPASAATTSAAALAVATSATSRATAAALSSASSYAPAAALTPASSSASSAAQSAASAAAPSAASLAASPANATISPPASAAALASAAAAVSSVNPGVNVAARKLSFKERRELETLEARIAEAEARKAEIESILAGERDFAKIGALTSELQALLAGLDADMNRWAELAE